MVYFRRLMVLLNFTHAIVPSFNGTEDIEGSQGLISGVIHPTANQKLLFVVFLVCFSGSFSFFITIRPSSRILLLLSLTAFQQLSVPSHHLQTIALYILIPRNASQEADRSSRCSIGQPTHNEERRLPQPKSSPKRPPAVVVQPHPRLRAIRVRVSRKT